MKFGKEFAAQMVQEWQEAYVDYSKLKSILKDILRFKQQSKPPSPMAATTKGSLKRRVSLYRAFSGLTSRYRSGSPMKNNDDEVILVSAVQEGGREGDYQTMFLMSGEEGGEYELVFFRRLDDEFNKVIKFYRKKVEEVMVEADELSKQMNALIALRIKVDNPVFGGTGMVNLAANEFSSNSSSVVHPTNGGRQGWTSMDVIQEVEMSSEGISEEEMKEGNDREKFNGGEVNSVQGFRPSPLDALDHVKINVELETPISTLKGVIKSSKSDLSFSRQELRTAEEKITRAFVEFYRKLRLLKSYCFLNQLAFSKIMKKYDKITSRNASKAYLQMVDKSYLGSSDEVNKLMERVEDTYVKHFANGNHRKGMKTLRPKAKKERHIITFLYGKDLVLFGYIVLHMLMYSGNLFFWKCYRVNFSFIFGFKQGTELGYREVLLLSSGLSLLVLAGVISHLDMEIDPRTKSFRTLTELIPFALLICLRRLFEEKDVAHGLNGLKYFSTIAAVAIRTIYQFQMQKTTTWQVLAAATSGIATIVNTYWDIVIDWGLLIRNSRNPWLRDKLILPHKGVYFVAMLLNCLLRLVWMQQVLGIKSVPFLHNTALIAVVASLEIIRRGIWNFFRLENEHLNNVGKYRAFKSVPLPFYYDYSGDKRM
ncbi:hypothetical protein CRYUN_Cryun15aG0036300 [Craigia yunnanensis]